MFPFYRKGNQGTARSSSPPTVSAGQGWHPPGAPHPLARVRGPLESPCVGMSASPDPHPGRPPVCTSGRREAGRRSRTVRRRGLVNGQRAAVQPPGRPSARRREIPPARPLHPRPGLFRRPSPWAFARARRLGREAAAGSREGPAWSSPSASCRRRSDRELTSGTRRRRWAARTSKPKSTR